MKASKSKVAASIKKVNFKKSYFNEGYDNSLVSLENIINEKVQSFTECYSDPFDGYKVIAPWYGNFWDNGFEDIEINSII